MLNSTGRLKERLMMESLQDLEKKVKKQIKVATGIPEKYIRICSLNTEEPIIAEYLDTRISPESSNYGAVKFIMHTERSL
jgi:hypothetical protein